MIYLFFVHIHTVHAALILIQHTLASDGEGADGYRKQPPVHTTHYPASLLPTHSRSSKRLSCRPCSCMVLSCRPCNLQPQESRESEKVVPLTAGRKQHTVCTTRPVEPPHRTTSSCQRDAATEGRQRWHIAAATRSRPPCTTNIILLPDSRYYGRFARLRPISSALGPRSQIFQAAHGQLCLRPEAAPA